MTIQTKQSFERRLRRKGIELNQLSDCNKSKLDSLKGLEFWVWDKAEHESRYKATNGLCCFNHAVPVGLPKKNGEAKPLFPYEQTIYDALMNESEDKKKRQTCLHTTVSFLSDSQDYLPFII